MRRSFWRILSCLVLFLSLGVLAPAVATAQEEETPETFIYATYFDCNAADQWLADLLVEHTSVEHWDAGVDDKTIGSWGWLSHHTGGHWRRLHYHTAPTLEAVLAASSKINDAIDAESPMAGNELARICPSHDDYVWRRVAGSPAATERGKVGFSVYYVCDTSKEVRADEIIEESLGAIYDRHVGAGKLTTWGWNEHIIGGEYRRLATMTAADEASLMKVRSAIIEEMFGGDTPNPAAVEFDTICGAHQDYIWTIVHEKP